MLEKLRSIINPKIPSPYEAMRQDWTVAGNDWRSAMTEVSSEIGGEELVSEVRMLAGEPTELLPNPQALKLLESRSPGAAEAVAERAKTVQAERIAREKGSYQI